MRGLGKVADVPGLTTRFCPCTHPRNGTFFGLERGDRKVPAGRRLTGRFRYLCYA